MSNKTTARWANTRFSERLGIKEAKEQVIASLLCAELETLETLATYVDHISPAVIDDAFAAEAT